MQVDFILLFAFTMMASPAILYYMVKLLYSAVTGRERRLAVLCGEFVLIVVYYMFVVWGAYGLNKLFLPPKHAN